MERLPFAVNRNDARSLLDQVADGLRDAIVSGHWKPGDAIPSSRELVDLLGVSRIVTKAALARLAAEGYIVSRTGLKPVVRDRGEKQWNGHVAFVCPDREVGYFQTLFADELRNRMNEAGLLFSHAGVRMQPDRACDFSILDAVLSRSISLAVVLYDRPQICRYLAKRGIPHVSIGATQRQSMHLVGNVRFDYNLAVSCFAAACASASVREVVQVGWLDKHLRDATTALRAAGIRVRNVTAKPDFGIPIPETVERAGYKTFTRLVSKGSFSRDTVYLIFDDYLMRGALTAILEAGLRIPDDIRLATWANRGLGPMFSRPFSRMEMDPVEAGRIVADALLAYLRGGAFPPNVVIGPKWIEGGTI